MRRRSPLSPWVATLACRPANRTMTRTEGGYSDAFGRSIRLIVRGRFDLTLLPIAAASFSVQIAPMHFLTAARPPTVFLTRQPNYRLRCMFILTVNRYRHFLVAPHSTRQTARRLHRRLTYGAPCRRCPAICSQFTRLCKPRLISKIDPEAFSEHLILFRTSHPAPHATFSLGFSCSPMAFTLARSGESIR